LAGLLSTRAIINGVTSLTRPARSYRPALGGAAALCLTMAACGGSAGTHAAQLGSSSTSPTPSTQVSGALAFAHCMRTHGVPRFPDPDGQGNFPPLNQDALGVSKQTSLAANQACKGLMRGGGGPATPQQREQKVVFGLEVARCLRAHGFPNFPDPGGSSQALPPGIDPSSPRFQSTETACEKQTQRAMGLP
jgi:hypothetical protein